jgi:hypothetical protein
MRKDNIQPINEGREKKDNYTSFSTVVQFVKPTRKKERKKEKRRICLFMLDAILSGE